MFKPLQLYIGLRYTRAKRRNHFISFISATSMLGIAVGVTALITVMSVMNGFEKELRERILGMVSHATISGIDGGMPHWPEVLEAASAHPEVVGAAPFIERETLLRGFRVRGSLVRGVEPGLEQTVSDVGLQMEAGQLDELQSGKFNIILGVYLASSLGVNIGDR